jgi:PAS domain S-box-containing protein
MTQILVPVLYVFSGVCFYAAMHHAGIALRRPLDRLHLLFATMSLLIACYVLAKIGAYQAETVAELVSGRRWEAVFSGIVFALLPWFVAEYTGVRQRLPRIGFSLFFAVIIVVNAGLPYGVNYAAEPVLTPYLLPWGEQVADLRVRDPSAWHRPGFAALLLALAYGLYACTLQYRRGQHHKAVNLALALGMFLMTLVGNLLVNMQVIDFVHVAELGFTALVVMMSQSLSREISQRDQRMHTIINQVPMAVYVKDLAGRYLLSNRHHRELLDQNGDEFIGKSDVALYAPAVAKAQRNNDRRVIGAGTALEFNEEFEKDGKIRYFHSLKIPLLDADGVPYGLCGITTDITERHESERDLRALRRQVWHAERAARIGALNASIAHELNQPLTAILSNAQAGVRFLDSDEVDLVEFREILQDIARDSKRAGAIISGLRDLLRRRETPNEDLDMAEVIGNVLRLMHSEFVEEKVQLDSALVPDCHVHANRSQIQQVIINLLQNAVEAMQSTSVERRRLAVSLSRHAGQVRVAVRDCGPGIAPDQLANIFTAFYTTKLHGLGLGLGVCQAIIEAHGSSLQVENNADCGATFSFSLPAIVKPAADQSHFRDTSA